MMKSVKLIFLLFIIPIFGSAQTVISRNKGYKDFLRNSKDLDLVGKSVLVIKAQLNSGTYFWFLNQTKSNIKSMIDTDSKTYNLLSKIFLVDKNGTKNIMTFKDFAEDLVQPYYLLDYCLADDKDDLGNPAFYLTYFISSDGLDAKPLKVLVYILDKTKEKVIKSKATAYVPFQESDKYRIVKDDNFKNLPKYRQNKALWILKDIKNKRLVSEDY